MVPPDAWYVKDESIYHPRLFPIGGASLQDIRAHYLEAEDESSVDVASETWYTPKPTVYQAAGLCDVCRHINIQALLGERTRPNHGPILILRNVLAHRETCALCMLITEALCRADGQSLQVQDLEDDDNSLGCWIRAEPTVREHSSICTLMVHRRMIGMSGGFVGRAGLIHQVRSDSTRPYGRTVPRTGGNQNLAQSWIKKCEVEHSPPNPRAHLTYQPHHWGTHSSGLRLVDLQNDCVITASWETRYVALSYVWGKVIQLEATMQNSEELSMSGSLLQDKHRARLPATIRDAMRFVKSMGEGYLWVDALCITQDHPETNMMLRSMDMIYNHAAWCLVAASATHANSPLPRINSQPDVSLQDAAPTTTIQELTLAAILPPLATKLGTCDWNTRAWTYQEGILSARLLFLFDDQMHFNCFHGYSFCEDIAFESLFRERGDSFQVSGQIYNTDTDTNFEVYASAVEEYSARNMSYQEDAIKAFDGILSILRASFDGDFLDGLPNTELDQALLWQPKTVIYRRMGEKGNPLFPTWSWAGWEGGVKYWPNLAISRLHWRVVGGLPDAPSHMYFTSNQLRSREFGTLTAADTWEQNGWVMGNPDLDRPEWWVYDLCYYHRDNPTKFFLHPVAKPDPQVVWRPDQFLTWPRETQYLSFRCMSTTFNLTGEHGDPLLSAIKPCTDGEHNICALKIFTKNGHRAGTVQVPGSLKQSSEPRSCEFICLSRTHLIGDDTPATRMRPLEDDFDDTKAVQFGSDLYSDFGSEDSILDPQDFVEFDVVAFDAFKPWCIYNVMLIDTHDGISQRVGLGKVHIDAFLEQDYVWKDVTLG